LVFKTLLRNLSVPLGAGLLGLSALFFAGPDAGAEDAALGYKRVTGPCNLVFPKDHGAHPGYRTEWWYYTGNLQTENGSLLGYQLTIFRHQISPPKARIRWPERPSAWRTQQLYLAHLAISDINGARHYQAEDMSREALDLAGQRRSGDAVTLYVKNWQIHIEPGGHRLQAETPSFGLDLSLQPLKDPVLHGVRGYSRKGSTPERASCYASITRLQTAGTVSIGGKNAAVSGLSWMDHEFSTAPLEPGIGGWDWFSLQMENGWDFMFFLLRQENGKPHPASSGTLVDADGAARHVAIGDFRIDALDHWQSPHSGARYPARWRLRLAAEGIDLIVEPSMADQEMRTPGSTGVTYWEGSVSVRGAMQGRPAGGRGYVELTGYAERFAAEM
jgi:predicted secreted hydrolase